MRGIRMKQYKATLLVIAFLVITCGIIYATPQSPVSNIRIDPNPVFKSTLITLTFIQTVDVDIVIENENGEVIKTLYSGEITAGVYQYPWDRIGDNGTYTPEGEYNLSVNYEMKFTSTKKTIILK
jgi:flagellar hook assembly protein FlgD